jgi:hypothetical protein
MSVKNFGMTKENNNPSTIDQFLNTLRTYNTSIGNYEQHIMLDDSYTYSVKLSNGSIRIYMEELEDKTIIPQERLKEIAKRFNERR